MSAEAFLLFPHQLFKNIQDLQNKNVIVLLEHPLFFGNDSVYPLNYHAKKLILHRASMQYYLKYLEKHKLKVVYKEYNQASIQQSLLFLQQQGISTICYYQPHDYILEKRLNKYTKHYQLDKKTFDSPAFINTQKYNKEFFKEKKFFMQNFYQHQRKRLNILVENGLPSGGKWSFDSENRKKIPKNLISDIPQRIKISNEKWVQQAQVYVQNNLQDSLLEHSQRENFEYPISHAEAEEYLEYFLSELIDLFGPYEDAIVPNKAWLFHSVLSPALNIGLLTPDLVIQKTLRRHAKNPIPLNSLEGFIRQIIGWREFINASYNALGTQMRNNNYWNHHRPMPLCFYQGNSGLLPVDETIKKLKTHAYNHHIERLMVLGNIFFLCEINPKDIYKWFMEHYIDAYDWVMVPNVYAMSQNTSGGLITTKPYFSGSNYIKKMSHYQKGEWCDIWDALYWRFISKHSTKLSKNPRWAMMCSLWSKKTETQKENLISTAEKFLMRLSKLS